MASWSATDQFTAGCFPLCLQKRHGASADVAAAFGGRTILQLKRCYVLVKEQNRLFEETIGICHVEEPIYV